MKKSTSKREKRKLEQEVLGKLQEIQETVAPVPEVPKPKSLDASGLHPMFQAGLYAGRWKSTPELIKKLLAKDPLKQVAIWGNLRTGRCATLAEALKG